MCGSGLSLRARVQLVSKQQPPRQSKKEGPPTDFPASTPPYFSFDIASYVETVMELQRSMATLTERVSFLLDHARVQETKLNEVRDTVRSAKTAVYVVGVVLTLVGAILAFLITQAVNLYRITSAAH